MNRLSKLKNGRTIFKSFFKLAFRNLVRNQGYSMINIGGLALGMAVAMIIGLWVYDELTFDQYHANYSRIAKVMQHQTYNGEVETFDGVPNSLEETFRTSYQNDFEYVAQATSAREAALSNGDKSIIKTGGYVQSDFPEMLSLRMIRGTRGGLKDPAGVFLSSSTAVALFGNEDPINQVIRIDNKIDAKVAGVYQDLPHNTTFGDLSFMGAWQLHLSMSFHARRAIANGWGWNFNHIYVQLTSRGNLDNVSGKIKLETSRHDPDQAQFKPELFLSPMSDWHLRSDWKDGARAGGKIQIVWMFGIVGAFVLLLACVNFMNLSTARSEKRAKEVGIRMVIGSLRKQLILQFLTESFLVTCIAFVCAALLLELSLPAFNVIANKKIVVDWLNPLFLLTEVGFIILTSLIAGSYPAFYLSSFKPVQVLKGTFRVGQNAILPRKILVVLQFTVSVAIVIGTVIVYQQIQYTKNRPIGYGREGLIWIPMRSQEFFGKSDQMRNELKSIGAIEELAESSNPITSSGESHGNMAWKGKDPQLQDVFSTVWIMPGYGKTIGWKIKEGRDPTLTGSVKSNSTVLNAAAVKYMGLRNPIGLDITWREEAYHVVGVIEDIISDSPYQAVGPAMYMLKYESISCINIRLNPEKDVHESIQLIETVFKKYIPSSPFDYKFVDDEYARKFTDEEQVGELAFIFAFLAILISGLGLFGLASFVAEQRTKEIGIRKVMGASIFSIWQMLSKDFVKLVVISCLLAGPVAYYYLAGWLEKYEYRTPISVWVFAFTFCGTLLVTLMTVSYQSIKAALMNPVVALRTE